MEPSSVARPPFLVLLGIALAGLAGVVSLVAMAVLAWEKFHTGHGWESYRTHWLVEFNWIGLLVLLASVSIALFVGLLFRLNEWRELKELECKYGEKRGAMGAPRQVRIAIGLLLAVLAIDAWDSLWHVFSDAEARANATLAGVWIAVSLSATLMTALFIHNAARRRNWARIALLVWIAGSWLLGLFYPQPPEDYSVWGWMFAASLLTMELAALYLLFRGKGGQWYSSAASGP